MILSAWLCCSFVILLFVFKKYTYYIPYKYYLDTKAKLVKSQQLKEELDQGVYDNIIL